MIAAILETVLPNLTSSLCRTQFNAKSAWTACLALSAVFATSANAYSFSGLVPRQQSSTCVLDSLLGRVGPSAGGRQIGLVIDVSGSMSDTDPENLRLVAAQALNDALISQSEAGSGRAADTVTVVDFASSAEVAYPLGDPSGANGGIAGLTPGGNTAIGLGIQAAIQQLTASGNDTAANRSGIVVFTDGKDNPISGKNLTISEAQRAAILGIRISFGFLTYSSEDQDIEILRAILESGGVYATIDQASTQSAFVALALANGLTGQDSTGVNATTTLLPGISTAKFLQTGSNTFSYAAQAGEKFNVTVEALDPIALEMTLRDASSNTNIATNTTDAIGVSFLEYTAVSAMNISVTITATNGSSGIFSVGLGSSIPLSDTCNITATPTTTQPAVYTGGAAQDQLNPLNFLAVVGSTVSLAIGAAAFGIM